MLLNNAKIVSVVNRRKMFRLVWSGGSQAATYAAKNQAYIKTPCLRLDFLLCDYNEGGHNCRDLLCHRRNMVNEAKNGPLVT